MNTKITTSLLTCALLSTSLFALEELGNIEVNSELISTTELGASSAIEIYTKKDIENSKSNDVYSFLNAETSVNVIESYGNPFSQKIDLRGYGIGDGYQNIVISVNGRRLNNIDMVPQLLSSIPISSIEKIEIIKGSGSVIFGDGANAGVINIITNGKNSNYVKTYMGSNGLKNAELSLSHSTDKFIINGYLDHTSSNGSRSTTTGEKDENYNKNKNFNLLYFPTSDLELRFGRTYSNMLVKYGAKLTYDAYKNDINNTGTIKEHYLSSYVTDLGLSYTIDNEYSLDFNYSDEDKVSHYRTSDYRAEYDYKSFNGKLSINKNKYNVILGLDGFNGESIGSSGTTSKINLGTFISGKYKINDVLTMSSGIRKEKVTYKYEPNTGTNLKQKENLTALDIGLNYNINENSSFFINYNESFQAPDINRFFKNNTFNAFIDPSEAKTVTLGYNNIKAKNKLKISLFRSNLKNEIYYYKTASYSTSFNTNIDKSHKYGLEIFDKIILNKNLYTSINYSYIVAKIDDENEGNGAYNGKNLPGVSNHNVTLNLGYEYNDFSSVLTHTYRSSSFALNDFENNFSQKQEAYNSTDLNLTYKYNQVEFFVKVENMFDKKNGLWIKDDNIYPVNFERLYTAGLTYNF